MPRRRSRAALSGVVAGVRFASKSYGPSLIHRSAVDQGLIAGGSFLAGFIAGATGSLAFDLLPFRATAPLLKAAGVVATGSRTAQMLSSNPSATEPLNDERAAWVEVGAEVMSAVALSRLLTQPRAKLAKTSATAALGVTTVAETDAAISLNIDRPDSKYLATSAGVGLGANVAIAAVIGIVRLGGWIPAQAVRSSPRAALIVRVVGSAATAGATALAARSVLSRVVDSISSSNRATEIAYSDIPSSSSVSGSQTSLVPYGSLGVQGRRLVSEVTTSAAMAEVMGEPQRAQAIRVYVGVDSAPTPDELVDLAMSELDRTGAFERSMIIAASPTGTGYVNYIAVEAAELMARGDCATVTIQYGSLPSMLSMDKVLLASQIYAALLTRVRKEIDERQSAAEFIAFGESLGAAIGQAGVDAASSEDSLIVDRALWVGTPGGSSFFLRLTSRGVPVFDHPSDLARYAQDEPIPDVVFLSHANDPVTTSMAEDGYTMPAWLKETDRGRGTNPHQRWLPAVSFLQGLIDTKNASTSLPGVFQSDGHDYRADLAEFIKVAYRFDDVSAEQMERIEDRLRRSEVERSAGIALGTIQPS